MRPFVSHLLLGIAAALVPGLLPVAARAASGTPQDEAALVATLLPEVVNISVIRYDPPPNDPHPSKLAAYTKKFVSGSGFVIDPSGLIITNAHVVEDASEIVVIFSDMVRRRAAVIYRSPIDMVVLKVHTDNPLAAIKWGNSETMRPGDPVIAIGNPLGIGTTVTSGIVSALDRDIQETPYDAFIQTDAAINHGNSGGPLFNLSGEVIGINTALYAPSGETGSVGLGFAIPGNDAQFVLDQVKKYGRVRQGWLGALVQPVNDSIGDAVGLNPPNGVIIDSVVPGSPAAQAGLRAGDIIMKIGSEPVADPRAYNRAVGKTPFGEVRPVTLWRDRMLETLMIKFTESPNSQPPKMDMADMAPMLKPLTVGDIGVTLSPVTPATRAKFKLAANQRGVVITNVTRNSIADSEGLLAGDVVVRAGGRAVSSTADLREAVKVEMVSKEHHILLMLQEASGFRFVALPLVRLEEDAGG